MLEMFKAKKVIIAPVRPIKVATMIFSFLGTLVRLLADAFSFKECLEKRVENERIVYAK